MARVVGSSPQPQVQPSPGPPARRDLRDQITRLERRLGDALATGFPHAEIDVALAYEPMAGPRILSVGDLEHVRDRLATKLAEAGRALSARADVEERSRQRLERMLLAPGEHRFERVANADLGEGGCGVWQVRPRLGLIGMLCGWWHVKLSSGCPLAA